MTTLNAGLCLQHFNVTTADRRAPDVLAYYRLPLFRLLIGGFWDFRPIRTTVTTRCTEWVKFSVDEPTRLHTEFSTHRCRDGVWDSRNCQFYEILEYKRPAEAYPLLVLCGQGNDWEQCLPWTPALRTFESYPLLDSYKIFSLQALPWPNKGCSLVVKTSSANLPRPRIRPTNET